MTMDKQRNDMPFMPSCSLVSDRLDRGTGQWPGSRVGGEEACQSLCEECQPWNDVWWVASNNFRLATTLSLDDLLHNPDCVVCQAVVGAVGVRQAASKRWQAWPASQVHVSMHGPFFLDTMPSVRRDLEVSPSQFRVDDSDPSSPVVRLLIGICITFCEDTSPPQRQPMIAQFGSSQPEVRMTPRFCFKYSRNKEFRLRSVVSWETPFFDVALLRSWLRGCELLHHARHAIEELHEAELPCDFRVIDVSSMQIVKPARAARFVALSYVWQNDGIGGHSQLERSNMDTLTAPGGLHGLSLPNIISDAISLCGQLGEPYLWVDRLCIVQDDAKSKHVQIARMDRIYQSATFTIVAALSNRNVQGLPGVSGRPRPSSVWSSPPEFEKFDPILDRNFNKRARAIIDGTLWKKRGWTFQEELFSKRCVFVTDFQAIFRCSRGHALEELAASPQGPLELNLYYSSRSHSREEERTLKLEFDTMPGFRARTNFDSQSVSLSSGSSTKDYFNWVPDYTSRQLAFDSDILNAFAGVSNALNRCIESRFIFGLPEKYMPQALSWGTRGLVQRRSTLPEIPSWSWASSLGPVEYTWAVKRSALPLELSELMNIRSLIDFHFQDPSVGLRSLDVEERRLCEDNASNDRFNLELWQECPHNPWQRLAHQTLDPAACRVASGLPGALVFNTTVAALQVSSNPWQLSPLSDRREQDFTIKGSEGARIGYVNQMSPEWIHAYAGDGKLHEFIVISAVWRMERGRGYRARGRIRLGSWFLQVMLVERLPVLGSFVWRRVGTGIIHAEDWKDCNPRWETIVLC